MKTEDKGLVATSQRLEKWHATSTWQSITQPAGGRTWPGRSSKTPQVTIHTRDQGKQREVKSQTHRDLLVAGELAKDVRVVGLALADGRVQGQDHHGVRGAGLGQHKDAHDGRVADLSWQQERAQTRLAALQEESVLHFLSRERGGLGQEEHAHDERV